MDKSVGNSRVINSSVSPPTPTHDGHASANPNNPAEFVNHGLLLWIQVRQQWVGHKKLVNQPQQLCEPKLKSFGFAVGMLRMIVCLVATSHCPSLPRLLKW